MKYLLAVILMVCVGCGKSTALQTAAPPSPPVSGLPTMTPEQANPFWEQARVALKSIGVEREPVSVRFHPRGIDGLDVEVPSLSSNVPNLKIQFSQLKSTEWSLDPSQQEVVDGWLKRSQAN